jgi:prophage regulatory protein
VTEIRRLDLQEVMAICAVGKSTLYEGIKGGQFPAPVHVLDRTPRWVRQEVFAWLSHRVSASRKQ